MGCAGAGERGAGTAADGGAAVEGKDGGGGVESAVQHVSDCGPRSGILVAGRTGGGQTSLTPDLSDEEHMKFQRWNWCPMC